MPSTAITDLLKMKAFDLCQSIEFHFNVIQAPNLACGEMGGFAEGPE